MMQVNRHLPNGILARGRQPDGSTFAVSIPVQSSDLTGFRWAIGDAPCQTA